MSAQIQERVTLPAFTDSVLFTPLTTPHKGGSKRTASSVCRGIAARLASAWETFTALSSKNLGNVFAAMASEWPTEY